MIKEIIIVTALGAGCYFIGNKIGESLPPEKATEIVNNHKEAYKNITATKIWAKNTLVSSLLTAPIIGAGIGSIALGVKGLERGAYTVIGEQKPLHPVSASLESVVMILAGAEGIRNTETLVKKEVFDTERTLKTVGVSSALLVPAAIIEEKEVSAG